MGDLIKNDPLAWVRRQGVISRSFILLLFSTHSTPDLGRAQAGGVP